MGEQGGPCHLVIALLQVWENKETKDVVRKMQELLLARGLRATDVLTVFHEFDTTNDGEIDIQEFKGALQVLGMQFGASVTYGCSLGCMRLQEFGAQLLATTSHALDGEATGYVLRLNPQLRPYP